MEAASEWKHVGDFQASPGAAVGELGLGQGRQQMPSRYSPGHCTLQIHIHILNQPQLKCIFCIEISLTLCKLGSPQLC